VTWKTLAPTPFVPATATGTPTATIGSGANGQWQVGVMVPGSIKMRITPLAAFTGTPIVTLQSSPVACAPAGGSVAGSGLTDTELRATPVPVSVSGGSTAAKQDTQITAEQAIQASTASIDTKLTSQGTAANQTAQQTPVTPATATATKGVLAGCQYNSTDVTFADGQQGAVHCDPKGAVRVVGGEVLTTGTVGGNTDWTAGAIDMTGFNSLAIQITSIGGGVTWTPNWSNDGVTYFAGLVIVSTNTGASTAATTMTATGMYRSPKYGKFFKLTASSYTSGTPAASVLAMIPSIPGTSSVNAAGTLATAGTISGGQTASDSPATGNPLRTGGLALTTDPTAVTTGDAVNFIATTDGKQIIYPWAIPGSTWQYASAADVTDTTSTEMSAAVASTRKYVKGCVFSNTDATVGTYVNVLSASTVIGVVYVAPQVAATSGVNSLPVQFDPPLRGGVNEAINFQAVTTSAQLRTMCQGFASTH